MEGRRNNEEIVVVGMVVQSRPMRSRRGARWAILTLQDRTGVIEALVFPEAFQKLEPILKAATPLLVKGRVAVEDVGTRLIVLDARPLDEVVDRIPSLLRVRVDLAALNTGALDRLCQLFASRPGRCRVAFELVKEDGSQATIEATSAVQADRELVDRVREICGAASVAVVQLNKRKIARERIALPAQQAHLRKVAGDAAQVSRSEPRSQSMDPDAANQEPKRARKAAPA